MTTDIWKLQDAKARFSEVVRRARAGDPQHVTLHGEEAVVIVDPKRFDISPKAAAPVETVAALPPVRSTAKAPAATTDIAPELTQPKAAEAPPSKLVERPVPAAAPAPKPVPPLLRPTPPVPKVERAPEPVPPPTPDAAALDLIAELEMELRRLNEPLPEPSRRRFPDDGK